MKKISLDTGIISLYLAKDVPQNITRLFQTIEENKIKAFTVSVILTEVYKHLCVQNGKFYAESVLISFLQKGLIEVAEINHSIVIKAGELKCKYRKTLSYNDCFLLAFSLLNSYEVHTTEKSVPSIYKLKVVPYIF